MRIAIGVFDGVHWGHRKVIEKADLVISFDPHPNGQKLLTLISERRELIKNLKVIRFNFFLKRYSPEKFVEKYLLPLKPQIILVGEDFHFGYKRRGNVALLAEMGKRFGFEVEVVKEFILDEHPVRSSHIRKLLEETQLAKANHLLGRDYSITGKIIKGNQFGTKLGFPTINLKYDKHKMLPGNGIYKGYVVVNNQLLQALIYIGKRPTLDGHKITVEAHLLDFAGSLYGKQARLYFTHFIRPDHKFAKLEDLIQAIKNDIIQARQLQN